MSSNTHQLAKNELLQAIAYFVERQKLVEQAILDFNYPTEKAFFYTGKVVEKLLDELISDGLINPDHTLV